jgi:glycosyltransferase involved in cell wall biosynthesis
MTRARQVAVAQINYAHDTDLTDPDDLLARYATLAGWSEAVRDAGGGRVVVLQRFGRNLRIVRRGIEYVFRRRGVLHSSVALLGPSVAHVNGLVFPAQTWLLRQALPHPSAILVQDHGGGGPQAPIGSMRPWVRRRGLRAADGFLFAASAQADVWRQAGLITSGQRVYEAMEASVSFRAMPRDEARASSGLAGEPAILWVGRLNANKDPLTVLDGFERALAALPGATLTMAYGSDDLLPDVRARIAASGRLRERVRLMGRVDPSRLRAFYSAADVFVLGSHHEGSGYALLEACACGAVPVVTDIPSFRAITADGTLGRLWPPGDAAALAAALDQIGRANCTELRARILDHFERTLSWPAIGRAAVAAYNDAADRRRRPARARSA